MAEVGYEWTELGPYGYLPTDASTLKRELDQRDLKLTGGVVMPHLEDAHRWPQIEKEVLETAELLAGMGAQYSILIDDMYRNQRTGEPAREETLEDDAWKRLIETTHAIAHLVKEKFDLRTIFHPHSETHVEYEHQIERLLDDTDPALIGLCLDTGHHAYRRGDPVAFLRKHHQRLEYLHLKSVDPQKLEEVVYQNGAPLAMAIIKEVFCEPSQGVVDFSALLDLLRDLRYHGYAIVEQDMYPAPSDKPLPIARRSRAYLSQIGFG